MNAKRFKKIYDKISEATFGLPSFKKPLHIKEALKLISQQQPVIFVYDDTTFDICADTQIVDYSVIVERIKKIKSIMPANIISFHADSTNNPLLGSVAIDCLQFMSV